MHDINKRTDILLNGLTYHPVEFQTYFPSTERVRKNARNEDFYYMTNRKKFISLSFLKDLHVFSAVNGK